jgi:16S rRNA (uracil1498-N3)-methyltransferase
MPDVPPLHAPIRHPHAVDVGRRLQLDRSEVEALRFRQVNVSEAFTLQGPDGGFYRAQLTSLGGRGGEALVYEQMSRSPESPLRLTLFCAVLARQRMLLVIPKATELGVDRVQPLLTAHSVPAEGLDHEKAHAWPNAAIRAQRQCRRASVPVVSPGVPLATALDDPDWRSADLRLFMDQPVEPIPLARGRPGSVALAVGPEGGWSDEERDLLRGAGASPLVLGGRVLRAETAVITGLAIVQHRFGDLTL